MIRITTGNREWFPNGSAHDATPEVQAQRIAAAANVLRPITPDIILLQEVRDYEACARLGARPSRREFITSQFALRLGNRSKVDWVNSKSRFYPNIKRKPRVMNLQIQNWI